MNDHEVCERLIKSVSECPNDELHELGDLCDICPVRWFCCGFRAGDWGEAEELQEKE